MRFHHAVPFAVPWCGAVGGAMVRCLRHMAMRGGNKAGAATNKPQADRDQQLERLETWDGVKKAGHTACMLSLAGGHRAGADRQ